MGYTFIQHSTILRSYQQIYTYLIVGQTARDPR